MQYKTKNDNKRERTFAIENRADAPKTMYENDLPRANIIQSSSSKSSADREESDSDRKSEESDLHRRSSADATSEKSAGRIQVPVLGLLPQIICSNDRSMPIFRINMSASAEVSPTLLRH